MFSDKLDCSTITVGEGEGEEELEEALEEEWEEEGVVHAKFL